MSNRIDVWIDKDLLIRAKANLEFLGLLLRFPIEWGDKLPKEWDDYKAAGVIQDIENDAEKLRWVLDIPDWRPTEDEEISAIKNLIKKHNGKPHRYDLSRQIQRILDHYRHNQNSAYSTVASLVEKFRTDLRAVQMMVRAFRQGGTHSIKNSRAYVAEDMIDQMVAELMEIDVDNPRCYDIGWGHTSFDFRKLQAENKAKDAQIRRMKEQIAALAIELKKVRPDVDAEPEYEDLAEYHLPF